MYCRNFITSTQLWNAIDRSSSFNPKQCVGLKIVTSPCPDTIALSIKHGLKSPTAPTVFSHGSCAWPKLSCIYRRWHYDVQGEFILLHASVLLMLSIKCITSQRSGIAWMTMALIHFCLLSCDCSVYGMCHFYSEVKSIMTAAP